MAEAGKDFYTYLINKKERSPGYGFGVRPVK